MRGSVALFLKSAVLAGFAAAAYADDTAVVAINHASCTGAPNEIRIVVRNVRKSVGLMTADLYGNDAGVFLHKEGRIRRVRFAAKAPVTAFCLDAPQENAYAIAVYHDKNANEAFDKNPLGLPAEPFGVSNNPPMRLGPPKIADALFDVGPGGATVEIELNN